MELDLGAVASRIDFDATQAFSDEDIKQPTCYEGLDWDVEYKDAHTWSLDTTLAIFLDKTLTGIMAASYHPTPDGIKRARDLFRAYATKDDKEYDPELTYEENCPFEFLDSAEYAELQWALQWLKDNFTRLWT